MEGFCGSGGFSLWAEGSLHCGFGFPMSWTQVGHINVRVSHRRLGVVCGPHGKGVGLHSDVLCVAQGVNWDLGSAAPGTYLEWH